MWANFNSPFGIKSTCKLSNALLQTAAYPRGVRQIVALVKIRLHSSTTRLFPPSALTRSRASGLSEV